MQWPPVASNDGFDCRTMLLRFDEAIASLLVQLDFGDESID